MAQACPSCSAPAYGHPSYNPRSDVEGMVYRFNCGECGNTWESEEAH